MYIPFSCSYVENGQLNYIFAWHYDGTNEQPSNQYFSGWIINSGNVYTKTGNTTKGIPGFDDTNFYSVFGS